METGDFDFELPQELIAQVPLPSRDESRLLVLQRATRKFLHEKFRNLLAHLRAGDVLVLNDSRVIPARLRGKNSLTGGEFELLLYREFATNEWWAMARPGKRARIGTCILIQDSNGEPTEISATVQDQNPAGHRLLKFSGTENILHSLDQLGEIPLPPYITRNDPGELELDRHRYQTVFAQHAGSVAAPTAGLHFTDSLLENIRALGVTTCFVTLHVGLGTFAPVKSDTLAEHVMHEEIFDVPAETARLINEAKRDGRRVIAVGTTSLRVLESVAAQNRSTPPMAPMQPGPGKTSIFIYPPYDFKIVDALLTNFHLPRSTLLMLVSAFAAPEEISGRKVILSAYMEAIDQRYRFFSYGDAMLIV